MAEFVKVQSLDCSGNPIKRLMRTGRYIECGCCSAFHHEKFYGDCRDNEERFHFFQLTRPDGEPVSRRIEIVPIEETPEFIEEQREKRRVS